MEGVFIAHYFPKRAWRVPRASGMFVYLLLLYWGSRRDAGEVSRCCAASCVVNKMFQQRPREQGGNRGRAPSSPPRRTLIGWRSSKTARCASVCARVVKD